MWEACACRTEPQVEREKAQGRNPGIGSLCTFPSYAERTLRSMRIINVKLAFLVHLKVYLQGMGIQNILSNSVLA